MGRRRHLRWRSRARRCHPAERSPGGGGSGLRAASGAAAAPVSPAGCGRPPLGGLQPFVTGVLHRGGGNNPSGWGRARVGAARPGGCGSKAAAVAGRAAGSRASGRGGRGGCRWLGRGAGGQRVRPRAALPGGRLPAEGARPPRPPRPREVRPGRGAPAVGGLRDGRVWGTLLDLCRPGLRREGRIGRRPPSWGERLSLWRGHGCVPGGRGGTEARWRPVRDASTAGAADPYGSFAVGKYG